MARPHPTATSGSAATRAWASWSPRPCGSSCVDWKAGRQTRRRVAARYGDGLAEAGAIRLPCTEPWAEPVWHQYAIEVEERDRVRAALRERGIATGVHYPTPIHLQPAYAHLGLGRGAFPEAERSCARVLSLPMYPELTQRGRGSRRSLGLLDVMEGGW